MARHHSSNTIDKLASASLEAATVSKRKIKDSVKKAVCNGQNNLTCYICGGIVLRQSNDPDVKVVFEHIWPASYGGDSIEENILPACQHCNGAKGNMLLWHTGHINYFVLKPSPSEEEFKTIRRAQKIARHNKNIYDFACDNKISLKQAALTIGPANMTSMYPQDTDDALDFFNFEFR